MSIVWLIVELLIIDGLYSVLLANSLVCVSCIIYVCLEAVSITIYDCLVLKLPSLIMCSDGSILALPF